MKAILELLSKLEMSLETHLSMNLELSPALVSVRKERVCAEGLRSVLAQYSLLPAHIVEFLSNGSSHLDDWANVKAELDRNIAEEMGSRTEGLSHYAILKRALMKELGLDISAVSPTSGTSLFLESIRAALAKESKPYAAGILYALEASAVPELLIVAHVINAYARIVEIDRPIDVSGMTTCNRIEKNMVTSRYSLNVFFASHLWDFEVGHKKGLASSLIKDLPATSFCLQQFEYGFEYVLSNMDQWWTSLSNPGVTDSSPHINGVIETPSELLA